MVAIRTERVGPAPHIAIDRAGAGELAIFLHGIGGNRTNWRDQLPVVAAEGFLAAAWDARGYLDSDDYDGPFSAEAVTDDLARVLDHLSPRQPVHLIGLSMGGRLSQELYHRHPHRIASLTLVDTHPGLKHTLSPEGMQQFLDLRRKPLLEGKTPADTAPAVARSLVSPRAQPGSYDRLVASLSALRPGSYLKSIDALLAFDRRDQLGQIRVPTHVIVGADDPLTPPEIAREMAAAIPGARLTVIPDAGHLSNIEQPAAFNQALIEFLRSQRRIEPRRTA